jgi:hypothetical protein
MGLGWLAGYVRDGQAAPTPRLHSDFCKSLSLQARISEPSSIRQKVNEPAHPTKPEELTQNEFSQPVMAQNRFHCFSE